MLLLLVRLYRDGTTYCWAGLFGSKYELSTQISPLGGWLVSALSIPIGDSSADFNPNHNQDSTAQKQASL